MQSDAEPDDAPEPYPWETSAVLPEDRAMGLELELIELEHERDEAEHEGGPTAPIDEEIAEVRHTLEDVAEHVAQPEPDSHVDIDAPEASELVDGAEPN